MSEFKPNEAIVALGCSKGVTKHIFHKVCIDKMMDFNREKSLQSKCPFCKANVQPSRFVHMKFRGY